MEVKVTDTNLGSPKEGDSLLGLLESLDLVGDNEGNFADTRDHVSLGHDEGGHSGGGNSGADGVPLLGNVDLPVPPPPGLGGSEHTSTPAHVTESSLTGPVGSATTDTGNTGNSTSSS